MSATAPPTRIARDPANELYDGGADLVEAAVGIRRAAAAPDVACAVPGVLGCIEAALDELTHAASTLEAAVAQADDAHVLTGADAGFVAARRRLHFAKLEGGLRDGRDLAAATRQLAARTLTRDH